MDLRRVRQTARIRGFPLNEGPTGLSKEAAPAPPAAASVAAKTLELPRHVAGAVPAPISHTPAQLGEISRQVTAALLAKMGSQGQSAKVPSPPLFFSSSLAFAADGPSEPSDCGGDGDTDNEADGAERAEGEEGPDRLFQVYNYNTCSVVKPFPPVVLSTIFAFPREPTETFLGLLLASKS